MLAASVWSLLNPAIAAAETLGLPGWLPASVGLAAGVLFLLGADAVVTRFRSADSNSVYKCRLSYVRTSNYGYNGFSAHIFFLLINFIRV